MKKIGLPAFLMGACLIAAAGQNAATQNSSAQDTMAQNAPAQTHEPPAVMQIVRESVKEGRSAAHERVESDWAAAFRKRNFPAHSVALTSIAGPSEAWFLSGYSSFAAVEQGNQEIQKPGFKAEMDTLEARDGELRSNSRWMYAVYRKDMSFHPELVNIGKTRYVGVTTFRLKLGHEADFMEGSKKFIDANEKAGVKLPTVAYEVIAGAPAGTFFFMEPMESLKTFDEMPARDKAVREAMGNEDFQQLMKGAGDVFTSIEYSMFSINPRMSYVSKETEDVDPAFWRPKMTSGKTASVGKRPETPGQ
jgi:hypothetical protein